MRTLFLLAILAFGRTACFAADHPVLGRKLVISDPIPSNPHQRTVSVAGYDLRGDPLVGDPLTDGVTVTLFTEGNSSASQAFVLPPGAFHEPNGPGWKVARSTRRPRVRYTYVDERGQNGSIVSFGLDLYEGRRTSIRTYADGRGNNPTIDVVPPNPGTGGGMIAVIPAGDRFCVVFGGSAGGRVGKVNDATTFKVSRASGRFCPPAD